MSDNNFYSSRHSAALFSVALETIRNWADEFQEYLSPTATPGKGRHRLYSQDDLCVFSLVAEMKKQGMTYPDIHASLKNGSRGQPPALPPDEVQAIVVGGQERRLSVEVEYLQRSLVRVQNELEETKVQLKEAEQTREEKIRVETQLEDERKRVAEKEQQIAELKDNLSKAQQRIEGLLEKSGHEYARGMIEALERRGDLPKKE